MTAPSSPGADREGLGRTRIVFLGGVGEIGRNMTVFEHDGRLLILDAGLMFPTEQMLGVDLVLPDFTYVTDNADRIEALLLTHGHEDHIGSVPYLLRELTVRVFGTRLTLGVLRTKLQEHKLLEHAQLEEITAPGELKLGPFDLKFLPVCHSIPDGVATFIKTSAGSILHSGDFRIDPTPVDGRVTDLEGFAALGRSGIDLMLSDSTNAERPGHMPSERTAGEAVSRVIREAKGRVIVACFASNIHRVQQVIWAARDASRFVAFLGRSMHQYTEVARELGYLEVDESRIILIEDIDDHESDKVVVITTGSQGEPLSALSLMAARDHKWIELVPEDTVVLSATPIPGNESAVRRVIDGLYRIGCKVIQPPTDPVHVSGHGASEDLRHVLELTKPKWFIPVHGEYRQLVNHARIAQEVGVPASNTLVVEDGDVVELGDGAVKVVDRVHAGFIFVDGLGIGDVRDAVLRDRRLLADDGIIVAVVTVDAQTGDLLAGPDLISRGFVHEDEAGDFFESARAEIRESLAGLAEDEIAEWAVVRRHVRRALGKFVWEQTRRRPIILPVVMEV